MSAVPPAKGYFKRVREICDRYGVLLVLDEVMCGMGRTGTLHAWEQEGVFPDIQAIAKRLGGGYAPIGATLVSGKITRAMRTVPCVIWPASSSVPSATALLWKTSIMPTTNVFLLLWHMATIRAELGHVTELSTFVCLLLQLIAH